MKKILFIIAIASTFALHAQFGIEAGVNYNFSGDLSEITESTSDILHGAKSKTGFHGGIWYKYSLIGFFIKGELLYTQYENTYGNDYSMLTKKIDLPVVLGMDILGPLYIFAGPDFQYILNNEFSYDDDDEEVDYNGITMGLHLGVGVQVKRLSLDIRWEKALSSNTFEFVDDNFTLDARPNQFIFTLGYAFN